MLPGAMEQAAGRRAKQLGTRRSAVQKVLCPLRRIPMQRCMTASALSESMNSGADAAAADLVLRFASHGVASSFDAQRVSSLFHILNQAIGSNSLLHASNVSADGIQAFAEAGATLPASLSQDPLAVCGLATLHLDPTQIDSHVVNAASLGIQDLANSYASLGDAASQAAHEMDVSIGALSSLTGWAAQRLSIVQTMDGDAYASLSSSLNEVLDGLKQSVEHDNQVAASQYTNALVLGLQQLVTGLDLGGQGAADPGVTVEGMAAAQEAMVEAATKGSALTSSFDKGFLVQISMAAVAAIVASIPKADWEQRSQAAIDANVGGEDSVPLRYDPQELSRYFARRPVVVMQRNAHVLKYFCAFVGSLLLDARTGMWEKNMPSRAKWLREIAEDLGPTYIKFVQAASTRVDMIPQMYLDEFSKLQDNVPTFSTMEAREVLEEGLGCSVDQVFDWISEEPLAAASLGQVYRGKLRDDWGGDEVAIKVQRPGVLESAALDIFIMRRACLLLSKLPTMNDQWACALDDWASRFFEEMDYQLEACNTMKFQKDMSDRGLEGVMVATVFPQLTSRKVIVTEWIVAERLADTSAADVKAMCATLLNCYLIQLLETGLLHADPHPGNLMRTPDGKIVILDFGLVTEVREEQRIALVEFISHLMLENWLAVSEDLVKLGFMPEGLPPGVSPEQIAPFLQSVMGQLVKGGGIRGGINIVEVGAEFEGAARNYKLCIPPYFALVVRAFAVIEGIALNVEPNYAIIHQCLPYLSRRLLTDNNPRMRAALKDMLYGDSSRLNIQRLQKLMDAFSAFTSNSAIEEHITAGPSFSEASSASSANSQSERIKSGSFSSSMDASDDGPIITPAAREALRVVFSVEGSYAQELIVDELVAATDAMSREALSQAMMMVLSSATTVSTLRSMEALGPLWSMIMPLPVPTDMILSMTPMVTLTNEDRQALHTLRSMLDILQQTPSASGARVSAADPANFAANGSRAIRAAGEVVPLLPELMPGMRATLEMFLRQLVRRMALRLAEDLDPSRRRTKA